MVKNKSVIVESSSTACESQWKHKNDVDDLCRNCYDTTPLSSASSSFKDNREALPIDWVDTAGAPTSLLPPSFANLRTKSPVVHGVSANLMSIFESLSYQPYERETTL